MIASMQMNINHCRVWLFYNEMGAVAQCPNNWGVGSAFHPKKIHIFIINYGVAIFVFLPGNNNTDTDNNSLGPATQSALPEIFSPE